MRTLVSTPASYVRKFCQAVLMLGLSSTAAAYGAFGGALVGGDEAGGDPGGEPGGDVVVGPPGFAVVVVAPLGGGARVPLQLSPSSER